MDSLSCMLIDALLEASTCFGPLVYRCCLLMNSLPLFSNGLNLCFTTRHQGKGSAWGMSVAWVWQVANPKGLQSVGFAGRTSVWGMRMIFCHLNTCKPWVPGEL